MSGRYRWTRAEAWERLVGVGLRDFVPPLLAVGVFAAIFLNVICEQNASPTPRTTASWTANASPTPTLTPTIEAPTPTNTPFPPTPTSTPVTEYTPPEHTPSLKPQIPLEVPVTGGDPALLPLPPNTTVRQDGCASDGNCFSYNFYWAPTHEVVLVDAQQGRHQVQHELCHAHQHWSINEGAPLPPEDYDLESWYGTAEGQSWASVSNGWPWSAITHQNMLEDFAVSCSLWYVDPQRLLDIGGQARYDWMQGNLP